MKKILLVITKSNWGGAQRYVYDLAVHLPKDLFEVSVAVGGDGVLVQKLHKAEVRVIPIPHLERDVHIIKEWRVIKSLWNIFQNERPDVIHLNSSKIGGLGSLIALALKYWFLISKKIRFNASVIFTVHGWAFNEDRASWARSLIRLVQWTTTWFCDWVIIISNRDFRQAIHLPLVDQKKFILIPLGIPPESPVFLPKVSARAKLSTEIGKKIGARDKVIGTIAELTNNKGLKYLIDAALGVTKLPRGSLVTKFIIIGEGEDREKLQNQIFAHGLQDTVTLAGFIENAAEYIKGFDIFILPSLKEGLPYTILESMSAEVPIVATRVGGVPDLVENETNGFLVSSKNSAALATALEKLLADKKMRDRFARESAKKVSAKFSFETMLRHTIALYQQNRHAE